MAKDGTARGGPRVGQGRKPKALAEKLAAGNPGHRPMLVMDLPEGTQLDGEDMPEPGVPESFRVLIHELQALAVDVRLLGENGEEMDLKQLEQEELKEETTIDMTHQKFVNDAETQSDLTVKNGIDEVQEAAVVGFDDADDSDDSKD